MQVCPWQDRFLFGTSRVEKYAKWNYWTVNRRYIVGKQNQDQTDVIYKKPTGQRFSWTPEKYIKLPSTTMTQRKCRNYMLETLKMRPFGKWGKKILVKSTKTRRMGVYIEEIANIYDLVGKPFSKEDPPQNTNLFPRVNRDYLAANAATNRNNYKRKPFYQKHRSHLSRMHKIRQTKSFTEYSIHRIGQATYQEWTRNQNSTEISRFWVQYRGFCVIWGR